MAKNSMTTVKIGIDNQIAVQKLEELRGKVNSLSADLLKLNEKLNDKKAWGPTDTKNSIEAQITETSKKLAKATRDYEHIVSRVAGIDDMLANISGASYNILTRLRTTLTNTLKNRKRETEDELKAYEETAERLQKVRDEISRRDVDVKGSSVTQKAEAVLATPSDYSTAEISAAIKTMETLRNQTQVNTVEWQKFNNAIKQGQEFLDGWNSRLARTAADKRQMNLPSISNQALSEQKKYWESMIAGAEQGSAALDSYKKKLSEVTAEEQRRTSAEVGKVMGNLQGSSVTEIQEAIKVTEKLRDAQARGSQEYEIYNEEIKRATEYLKSYTDLEKQIEMDNKWQNLASLSANALAEQKKYWQEMAAGAEQGSTELAEYEAKLKEITNEERKRSALKAGTVMGDLSDYSVKEIEEAIRLSKELQAAQKPGGASWKFLGEQIENARNYLERYNDELKQSAMADKLSTLATASTASLAEQKKYWQEMAAGAEQGSAALVQYQSYLSAVTAEEQRRMQLSAQQTIADVELGNWDKTIAESKEAVKQLQQYRDTLRDTDKVELEQVDQAIASLNARIKGAQEGVLSMTDALAKVNDLENFDGTIEDLEKLKKRLQEIRNTEINIGDADSEKQIKEIDDALKKLDARIKGVSQEGVNLDKVLGNLEGASFKELEQAAKQLKEEVENCEVNTTDFIDKSEQLREVNKRLDEIKSNWNDQENVILRTAKRLTSYVLVYGGFNEIVGKIKQVVNANLELSDSLADIQKTTGMSNEEVANLSRNIDKIDTRSSQAELHELAAAAGQIGLRSQEDVLGFVKASNMITVSLNELGSEGTTSLMKIAQLTGDIDRKGVEGSLKAIGSAINELSANSSATAGPIVDLMNRMGGIASTAKISSAEMAAIGATADALGQSMEVTGTSMNKFISTVMSKTDQVAYALNMDAKALRGLIENGQTMEAMIQVFERMNEMGGLSELAPVMGDLGSEGARMTQVLASMSQNVDFLRSQVDLSRDAFAQATSIQNEYNVKNENAIALLQRMGNTITENVVNSGFVEFLTDILQHMSNFVNWMNKGEGGARVLEYVLKALAGTLALGALKLDSFAKALFKAKTYTDAWTVSWKKLGMAMKANWVSLLISAVASLVLYLRDAATHVSELTKAQAEYGAELSKEENIMNNLFATLKSENTNRDEKKKLLYDINKRYGEYIGFLLKEGDSINKINAAYDLANAKLRERMTLKVIEKKEGIIQEEYAHRMRENEQDLRKAIDEFAPLQRLTSDAMSAIRTVTLKNLDKSTEEITALISEALGEVSALYDPNKWKGTNLFDGGALGDITEFIEIQKAYNKDITDNTKEAEEYKAKAVADIERANARLGIAMVQEFDSLMKKAEDLTAQKAKETNEDRAAALQESLNGVYRQLLSQERQFSKYVSDNTEKLTQQQLEGAIANRDRLAAEAEQIRKVAPFADAWGKEANLKGWKETFDNLDTASVDSLVSTYKELRDASMLISDVTKYNAMFETSFSSLSQVMEDTHDKAEMIKKQLASMGRTTTGDFLWKSGGSGNSARKKAQQEYKAALSALDAYYKERESVIRQEGAKENKLQSTIDRELEKNQTKWQADKVELIKMLVGDVSKFDPFDNEGYMGVVTKNVFFGQNRNTDYLKQLAGELSRFGIVLEDGMRNTLASALVGMGKTAETEVERMKKILLQDDFTEQVAQQYMESLDTLGLLFGLKESELTTATAELGRIRLEAMRDYADQSYSLTAAELEKRMKQSAIFDEWTKDRSKESYEVLLNELRKFHDDQEEADRKAAERRLKIMENSKEGRDLTQKNEANIRSEEQDVEMWDRFKGMDLVTDDTVDRAQIDVYQAKIAASQAWIDQIEAQMAVEREMMEMKIGMLETDIALRQSQNEDTSNQESELAALRAQSAALANQQGIMTLKHKEEIADAQQQIYDREMAMEQRKVSEMKKYTDTIVDFSGQMGEAAFGEVEDRQEAGKQLIKSVLTTLKDWIQAKLTELAMQQLFAQQSTAISGQQTSQELGMTAAKTSADIAAGTASATAKEAGSKGLLGLAVGAAIGAALSALLGMAMGALNKSKSEVASISGAGSGGRLATGMLTYAEGNYPVLGNDGQVYNAKYEGKGMKTGVYGGGAHFGIFSEKQPEAIIDGKTTRNLMLNYPEIWKSIVTLSRVGRIERGVPTFATGNIQELAATTPAANGSGATVQNEQWAQMQATLAAMQQTQMMLMQRLNEPIRASINMYGEDGIYKSMEKSNRFTKRVRY